MKKVFWSFFSKKGLLPSLLKEPPLTTDTRVDQAVLDGPSHPNNRTDAPGFALRGVPLYRRGVGMASVEPPVALSPTIRMRIGSTTKHFCALAVMLLAEEGWLALDHLPLRALPNCQAEPRR